MFAVPRRDGVSTGHGPPTGQLLSTRGRAKARRTLPQCPQGTAIRYILHGPGGNPGAKLESAHGAPTRVRCASA